MKYAIQTTRSAAVLYLAWEYGLGRAAKMKSKFLVERPGKLPLLVDPTFLRDSASRRFTRRAAERYAARVREVVAYQEGRLGRPVSAGAGVTYPVSLDYTLAASRI